MLCVALMTVQKPTQEAKNIIASGSIYIYNNYNCVLKLLVLEIKNFKGLYTYIVVKFIKRYILNCLEALKFNNASNPTLHLNILYNRS